LTQTYGYLAELAIRSGRCPGGTNIREAAALHGAATYRRFSYMYQEALKA
jgi:hypothetical protein